MVLLVSDDSESRDRRCNHDCVAITTSNGICQMESLANIGRGELRMKKPRKIPHWELAGSRDCHDLLMLVHCRYLVARQLLFCRRALHLENDGTHFTLPCWLRVSVHPQLGHAMCRRATVKLKIRPEAAASSQPSRPEPCRHSEFVRCCI